MRAGAEGYLQIPPDPRAIDASHRTVMPGLMDAQVHTRMSGASDAERSEFSHVTELRGTAALKSCVNASADLEVGFTAVRDAGGGMYEDSPLRDAIDEGWLEGSPSNHGTQSFTDCDELLDPSPGIAVAVISLPHHLRREGGLAAADAGSHIPIGEAPGAHVGGCTRRDRRVQTAASPTRGQPPEFMSEDQTYPTNVEHDENLGAQARCFVTAVRDDRELWITGLDGLLALEAGRAQIDPPSPGSQSS